MISAWFARMGLLNRLLGQKAAPSPLPRPAWPFHEPERKPALTTSQVIGKLQPIRVVIHEAEDGIWRFLTGGGYGAEDVLCASLREIMDVDPTVGEVADLPLGWRAERERVGGAWRRLAEPETWEIGLARVPQPTAERHVSGTPASPNSPRLTTNGTQDTSYAKSIIEQDLPPAITCCRIMDAMHTRHFPGVEPWSLGFEKSLAVLSRAERALVLAWHFNCEIHCNGLEGYFQNTRCRYTHEVLHGLEMFGLSQAADLLKQALMACKAPVPIPDDYVYILRNTGRPGFLEKISKEFDRLRPTANLEQAAIDYVRCHLEEFV